MDENQVDSSRRSSSGGPHGTVVLSGEDLPDDARTGRADVEAVLVGLTAPFMDRRFRLQAERTRVGRGKGNDISLSQPDISQEHARIVRASGEWRVVDLNSTNGTFVNGARVNQSLLQYGDQVAFGPASFIFAPGGMSTEAVRALRNGRNRRMQWLLAGAVVLLAAVALFLWLR